MKTLATSISAATITLSAMAIGVTSANACHNSGPDLVIRSVDLYATGGCGFISPAIVGDVVIKNRGDERAKALWISPLVSAWDADDKAFKDADIKINSLAPGETVRARVRIGILRNKVNFDGVRTIRIKADPNDRISEVNEWNNTYAVRVRTNCS